MKLMYVSGTKQGTFAKKKKEDCRLVKRFAKMRVITCDGFYWPKSNRTSDCRTFVSHSRSNRSDDLARSAWYP